MSRSHRIRSLLGDEDFLSVVSEVKATLTKKVMNAKTLDDERAQYLAEFHAMDKLVNRMRAIAQDAKDT